MDLNDWILALHVLSAFAFVGALVVFTILIVASRNIDTPGPTIALAPVGRVGNVTVIVGALGTILFGVWLAISLDAYQVWDGWVIAAIVLWAIGGGVGARAGKSTSVPCTARASCRHPGRQGRAPSCSPSTARRAGSSCTRSRASPRC